MLVGRTQSSQELRRNCVEALSKLCKAASMLRPQFVQALTKLLVTLCRRIFFFVQGEDLVQVEQLLFLYSQKTFVQEEDLRPVQEQDLPVVDENDLLLAHEEDLFCYKKKMLVLPRRKIFLYKKRAFTLCKKRITGRRSSSRQAYHFLLHMTKEICNREADR